jgi:starvation-inducible outer membrane lipoprotein
MKTNIILSIGILTIALVFSGCGAAPPTANAAKPAASNSANKTTDSTNTAANSAAATKVDGDVLKIDVGHHLEQFSRQMHRRPVA